MVDFIIGAVIYSLIIYFFTFVGFMFTMNPCRTKSHKFFRTLLFITAPISVPFYLLYLIKFNRSH